MNKFNKKMILALVVLIALVSAYGVYAASGTGITIPTNTGLADPQGGVKQILNSILVWLLGIVGIIALIAFVISGIQYLTAAGNEKQMEAGKNNLIYSIIGVVVASAGMVIVKTIEAILNANI